MSVSLDHLGPGARAQAEAQIGKRRGRSRAVATVADGMRFPSATQARVYARVKAELGPMEKLVMDARFPLVAVAPRVGRAHSAGYISVDFTVWAPMLSLSPQACGWRMVRAVDAKPRARAAVSRDWRRGARAFAATYGIEIEEVSE